MKADKKPAVCDRCGHRAFYDKGCDSSPASDFVVELLEVIDRHLPLLPPEEQTLRRAALNLRTALFESCGQRPLVALRRFENGAVA